MYCVAMNNTIIIIMICYIMEIGIIEQHSLTGNLPVATTDIITISTQILYFFASKQVCLLYKDICMWPCSYTYVQKVYKSLDSQFYKLAFAVPDMFMITVATDLPCLKPMAIYIYNMYSKQSEINL